VTTVRQTNTSRLHTDENAVAEVQVNDVGSKDGQEEASTDGQSSGDDYTPTGESESQHVRYRPYTQHRNRPTAAMQLRLSQSMQHSISTNSTDHIGLLLHLVLIVNTSIFIIYKHVAK